MTHDGTGTLWTGLMAVRPGVAQGRTRVLMDLLQVDRLGVLMVREIFPEDQQASTTVAKWSFGTIA